MRLIRSMALAASTQIPSLEWGMSSPSRWDAGGYSIRDDGEGYDVDFFGVNISFVGHGSGPRPLERAKHTAEEHHVAYIRAALEAGRLCNSTVEESPVVTPRAWTDVMGERIRQMAVEGWTPEHDDRHDDGELAAAGATYALSAANCIVEQPFHRTWPWQNTWWKPTVPRRDLVKAGALILAEIERLDRAALAKGGA